jgi:hypothetical protein
MRAIEQRIELKASIAEVLSIGMLVEVEQNTYLRPGTGTIVLQRGYGSLAILEVKMPDGHIQVARLNQVTQVTPNKPKIDYEKP